jgi:DMSO/TMAO reductase YedYZ molybdopterin-dependent catalytic subunit
VALTRDRKTSPPKVGAEEPGSNRRPAGALTGVLVAAAALGVGHLAAAFVAGPASPLLAVGQTVIDRSPEWLKSFAIKAFGTNDKAALLVGISVVLAVISALLGIAASRKPWRGYLGIAVLGLVGVAAALGRPTSNPSWAIPSVAAALAGSGAFWLLRRASISRKRAALRRTPATAAAPMPTGFDRRRFFQAALAMGATAVATGGLGNFIEHNRMATAARAALKIPPPATPAPAYPSSAQLKVPGISPFFTPDDHFYRVDTALFIPQLQISNWKLTIHGMVDHPMQLDFQELLARPLIERDITLNCVSNQVGGRYIGNARWIGAALKPILDEAGVHPDATQIVSRSSDGMTIGTPTQVALDGRDSMLAIAMNGQPLPFEHGFPVRMLVPGLYGYESATKWLVDIELTTLEAFKAYWVQRGWAQQVPVKTSSRIDVPTDGSALKGGRVTVAGIAWAQHRGISRVEVRVDQGPWMSATLAREDNPDTWRQWALTWNASPGPHVVEVRATDGTGSTQTGAQTQPFPSGSTGWDQVRVSVS